MDHSIVDFRYGKSEVKVALPSRNLLGVLAPRHLDLPGYTQSTNTSDGAEIERALANPIGSLPVESLVRPGMKIAIVVSDITRPSPTSRLLPPLINRLTGAGARDEDITIVFAMGIHRNHKESEKRLLVGEEFYRRFRCLDSSEGHDYVSLGETSFGTPLKICRPVVEADVLICTGNIEYHYFAGYSGGAKAVMPGCAGRATVEANHAMQLWPGAESGSRKDNPVRRDIEEAGKMAGIDFVLNVVLDEEKRIVRAVAGDVIEAHLAGSQVVDSIYGAPISEKSDIVVASCGGYPKDLNLYQAQKALENAARAVKPGGIIILLAECLEGMGEKVFADYMTAMDLDEILFSIAKQFVLGGHKAAAIARVLKKCNVILVTGMKPDLVKACKLSWAPSVKEALFRAFTELGKDATVWAMPYAGSTVPLMK